MSQSVTSVNPATGKPLKTYKLHSRDQVFKKIKVAQKSQYDWAKLSYTARAKVLRNVADILLRDKEKLALLATREMGKPIAQSRKEIEKCADTLRFYAKNAYRFLADELIATDAQKSYVHYEPLGVVLAIMPWNFPFWQLYRCAAPILMAGNTLVLKHASNVSGCAVAIEKTFTEAGASVGLMQHIRYSSADMTEIIVQEQIAAVTFTGSTPAGRKIAGTAAGHLKKQVLELGGSDAYVVLNDADLEETVRICVEARLVNTGQSCLAAKRFIIEKGIYEAFVEKFTEAMKAATMGSPEEEWNTIGPMARIDLRNELHKQVQNSVKKGAKILCGGDIPDLEGAFYPPTILVNVKKGMPAYEEELFGPVAAVIKAEDEVDAMRIANDSIYGLGGAIFTRNKKKGEQLAAKHLQAGSCFVNAQVHSDKRLPFGGIRQSGYGRELGVAGIREFVNVKTVFIAG